VSDHRTESPDGTKNDPQGKAPSEGRFVFPPLKRHPTLQPLSREHYAGLVLVRRLREAARSDEPARHTAAGLLTQAWTTELQAHFADEELLVGPWISDHDRVRLIEEHRALERRVEMVREIPQAPASAWLEETATMLESHIRWEERELFPAAERDGASGLDSLAHEAERIERERPGSRRRQDTR
jgi:hypothetical protein